MNSKLATQNAKLAAGLLVALTQLSTLLPQPCSAQTNCTPRPPGMIAWWPGDRTAVDVAGTNQGAFPSATYIGTGKVGPAFRFYGTNYVHVPYNLALNFSTLSGFSVAAWVAVGGAGANRVFVSKCITTNTSDWELGVDAAGRFYAGTTNTPIVRAGTALQTIVAHHVAFTYTNGNWALFTNGSLAATATNTRTIRTWGAIALGRRGESLAAPDYFSGWLDEVMVFNRALASDEIQQIYAASNNGICFTNDPAPVFVVQPSSQTNFLGGTATFTGVAMGSPRPSYQWLFDGTPVAGKTAPTFTMNNLSITNAGTYTLVASNAAGVRESQPVTLVIEPCLARPPGMVAWWPADGSALDVVGDRHGVLQNGVSFASGKVGTALNFDGVDDFVTNPSPDLGAVSNNFTIEFWAWPNAARTSTPESTSGTAGISGQRYAIFPQWGGTAGPAGAGVSVGSNGVSVYEHADNYLPSTLVFDTTLTGWTHIAVVYTNKQPLLYINGALVRVGLTSLRPAVFPSDAFSDPGGSGKYSGFLDAISIYNRALDSGEIAAIHAAGGAGKCFTNDPAPVFAVQPKSQNSYLTRSITLTTAAMGAPRPSYQWFLNGIRIAGATNNTLVLNSLSTNHAGNYVLLASNVFGAIQSVVATVTVGPFVLLDYSTTIAAGDTNYDGRVLIVQGATVTIDGLHSFQSLLLTNGAALNHSAGSTTGLALLVTGDCVVRTGCSINADGKGYGADTGPGKGGWCNAGLAVSGAGGGGYGGLGGAAWSSGGASYGSMMVPDQLGSGGGSCDGVWGSRAYGGGWRRTSKSVF